MTQWRLSGELDDFCWSQSGKMILYRDQHSFSKASRAIDAHYQRILSPIESCDIEPALAHVQHNIVGSIYSPSDETADCYKFCCALLNYLLKQPNFTLHHSLTVTNIELGNTHQNYLAGLNTPQGTIQGDDYIICAGNGSRKLLNWVGINVPIYPLKGYSLTLPFPKQPHLVPKVSVTDYGHKVVYAKLGDRLRIAAMVDIGYEQIDIRTHRITAIKNIAKNTFPQLTGLAEADMWSGLRPSTPKGPPILGKSPYHTNLWLNVGHGSLGFTLSAGSAIVLSQLITGNLSPISLEGLTLK